jgi:hypothetical protein
MPKWEGKHKHKCPDCGVIFDCPCGKSCGIEYDKYPCVNDIMKHCLVLHSTIQGAMEEGKNV